MKTNITQLTNIRLFISFLFLSAIGLWSCDPKDPEKEDTPELITKITLTFTPTDGSATIVMNASDPDGEGVLDITQENADAVLNSSKTYDLAVSLFNELAEPGSPDYNIGNEVEEEGNEHLLLFGWTGNLFTNPAGNGNIDNRTDPVNYTDTDSENLPIGLTTRWETTGSGLPASGTLRIVLKHQPGQKTATSGNSTGETDLDVTFNIVVQ
ncbi:MAG: hypothetical protein ACKORJ_11410 [Bacteroidota bacterium]